MCVLDDMDLLSLFNMVCPDILSPQVLLLILSLSWSCGLPVLA